MPSLTRSSLEVASLLAAVINWCCRRYLFRFLAYCFYRKNKLNGALELLDGQEKIPAVLQLESQIHYRLGKMDACMDSYEELQEFKIESLDLKVNINCCSIARGRASEVRAAVKALRVDLTT